MANGLVKNKALSFLKFVDASPSPFHVVKQCKQRLFDAGFKELKDSHKWAVEPMGKYFLTRNQSSIVAFAVGGKFPSLESGLSILGAHTDSPCLRIKVVSKRSKEKYNQVGVECYGGGIWPSWFDRDLKVAGRVLVRNDAGQIVSKLVHIDKPIMRIPNCCIHLLPTTNTKFSVDKEKTLLPVISNVKSEKANPNEAALSTNFLLNNHHKTLLSLISKDLQVPFESLIDIDLFLADSQPSTIGGANEDFIFAPRIDNLLNTHCGLEGLIQSCQDEDDLKTDPNVRVFFSFDNEEVGSLSSQGANSVYAEHVLRRLCASNKSFISFEELLPRSMVLSADMSHGVHPNYPDKHEKNMKPSLNGGVVIKTNNNQKYATTMLTATVIREMARLVQVPVQDVMVRNDSPCGSTIGPIIATNLGINTADVGSAQLSMHSCREVCGVKAPLQSEQLFSSYFSSLHKLSSILFD